MNIASNSICDIFEMLYLTDFYWLALLQKMTLRYRM